MILTDFGILESGTFQRCRTDETRMEYVRLCVCVCMLGITDTPIPPWSLALDHGIRTISFSTAGRRWLEGASLLS